MKIAIISDIHGNHSALQTALDYIFSHAYDRIICLGDVVGYGPQPGKCVELVRQHADFCIRGNHDAAVFDDDLLYYFNQLAYQSIVWTRKQLSPEQQTFLRQLPYTKSVNNLFFTHSSPNEPEEWTYLFTSAEAMAAMTAFDERICFVGHTHVPKIFTSDRQELYSDKKSFNLSEGKYIVNVGSIGQPRDGDPRLCFVEFDTETFLLKYVRLKYPIKVTYDEIIASKLPSMLGTRLFLGK
jgi:predicted phosphodiesterase